MNTLSDPKKSVIQFEGVPQEILQETSPTLSPEERDRIRKERESEGMMEFYGGARLNSMVSFLKSNSINKIRSREIYLDLEVDQIDPMESQPRHHFDQAALDDLKSSIHEKGLSNPILVRRIGERFQLIAGERRWRAFRELGKKKIPAIIKDVKDEKEAYILAAIENLQREDLNVVEEALCYQRMLETGAVASQKELSSIVGRTKSKISERLSLLKLPEKVKTLLAKKDSLLTEGHAIELLRLKEDAKIEEMAVLLVEQKLSRDQLRKEINALVGKPKAEALSPVPSIPSLVDDGDPEQIFKAVNQEIAKEFDLTLEELPKTSGVMPEPIPSLLEHPSLVHFVPYPDRGFDLTVRFRPGVEFEEDLKEIMHELSKRIKECKKLRKELRRSGPFC